jgi:hypothetical protein
MRASFRTANLTAAALAAAKENIDKMFSDLS